MNVSNNKDGIPENVFDIPIIASRNVLGDVNPASQDNDFDMIVEEDINMEGELEQLSLSSADGVSNGSNASLEMSDEEILDHLYQEKERLALRKRQAARLLALCQELDTQNK
ncbi:hypothetical protein BGZ50_001439, partial [Haplosporangium sp. Z 11]